MKCDLAASSRMELATIKTQPLKGGCLIKSKECVYENWERNYQHHYLETKRLSYCYCIVLSAVSIFRL